jgi:hypothetical protein
MKKNLHFMIVLVVTIIYVTKTANAQNTSPYWSLAGNSNASATSKLGTLNKIPLRLFTNGKTRLYIDGTSGNVSIGNGSAANGSYRLYVVGAGYGIYGSGTSYGIVGSGGSYGVYGYGTTAGLYGYGGTYGTYSYGSSYGVYGSGGTYGVYGAGTNYGVNGYSYKGYGGQFTSDSSDAVDAYSNGGFWGVYAYCPRYTGVYGYGGSYGTYGSSAYIGTYGYSSGTYGLYGYGNYGLYAETRNNSSYYAGYFVGDVYSTTGVYAGSDQKLKQNVRDVSSAMSIINQLRPKLYDFRHDGNYAQMKLPKGEHYGLIAQDLEKVLPNLVKNSQFEVRPNSDKPMSKDDAKTIQASAKPEVIDFKAVNYTELIPLLVKALQEEDLKIQQQNAKIEQLTRQLNALTASNQDALSSNGSVKLSSASLLSVPNPAKSSAKIFYSNIPSSSSAQLLVTDSGGKTIRQLQLSKSSSGSVNIDVSALSVGTYSCSLIVDGKLLITKTIEVAK